MRAGRITKSSEFSAVYARGRIWSNSLLVLRGLPNDSDTSRYGLVVSKRLGKAVQRNRIKRRLREIARLTPIRPGWDLVVIARGQAAAADYHQLREALTALLHRARLLQTEEQP